jgi:MFS family permease
MFSAVDGFESVVMRYMPIFDESLSFIMAIVEPPIAGFSALAAGVFSDWVGRKRVVIFGFVSLGIAYAVLGIASHVWISWLFHFVINGLAIGLLWLLFTTVLWGDMSGCGSEKYYAIGETPLFLTQIISSLATPYVASAPDIGTRAVPLASFFLFMAVIPLLYAQETLPEKKIRDRQLQIYTKDALQLKQKVEKGKK